MASKYLNCTSSLRKIARKINEYATKHEIDTTKVSSDNFTNLPVTFLVENDIENTEKFGIFFNILLNFFCDYAGARSPDINRYCFSAEVEYEMKKREQLISEKFGEINLKFLEEKVKGSDHDGSTAVLRAYSCLEHFRL